MKTVRLPSGEQVSALGQGTWFMGEQAAARQQEIAALRLGMDLGMTLIDTAEMYADGRAEEVVGKALSDRPSRRDAAFVVSKVYPHNASRRGTIAACERSLKRLQTDRIDLYLLHWRGQHPLAETVQAFEALKSSGKIRHWGVSNLDTDDMAKLWQVPQGQHVAANQVLYNLGRRGVEWGLLPWLKQHGVATMAYSPIEQARLLRHKGLGFCQRKLHQPGASGTGLADCTGRGDRDSQILQRAASTGQRPGARHAAHASATGRTRPAFCPTMRPLGAGGAVIGVAEPGQQDEAANRSGRRGRFLMGWLAEQRIVKNCHGTRPAGGCAADLVRKAGDVEAI